MLFGQLTPRTGLLQLSSAGHPTPFLVRATGVERPLLVTEAAIGVELDAALEAYPTEILQLAVGDLIVAFTDGIAELRDADGGFFESRMGEVLAGCHDRPAAEVVDRLVAAGEQFSARAAVGRPRGPLHPPHGPAGVNCSRPPADKGGIGQATKGDRCRQARVCAARTASSARSSGSSSSSPSSPWSSSTPWPSSTPTSRPNTSSDAAQAALTEYAQSQNAAAAKLAAEEQLAKNGLTMVSFKITQNPEGNAEIIVTAKGHADTYAFHFLGKIPPLKHWVQSVTNPVGSGSTE